MAKKTYRFGGFGIRTDERLLRRGAEILPVPRSAATLLLALLESPGRVVTKAELLKILWPGVRVAENNLNQAVAALRRALQDRAEAPRFLGTVSRVGYRFLSPVEVEDDETPSAPSARRERVQPAIAVLSFGADGLLASDAALAEGLVEGLTAALARREGLLVKASGAVRRLLARGGQEPAALGRALDVDFVVDGRLRRFDGALSASVELVRVSDGGVALGERVAIEPDRLPATEERLAEALAARVLGTRAGAEPKARAAPPIDAAYPLYLQGKHFAALLTPDGFQAARACFEDALARSPGFAPAAAGLSYLYIQANEIHLSAGEAMSRARRAAEDALRLDPTLAEAHACLATVRFMYDWDAAAADASFRAACAAPGWSPAAPRMYGWFLALSGRFDEAFERFASASDVDPFSLDRHLFETGSYWLARRWTEGERATAAMKRLFPELWLAHVLRGRVLEGLGDARAARAAFEEAVHCPSSADEAWADLGRRRAMDGDGRGAREAREILTGRTTERPVASFHFAQLHAGAGDADALFEALDAAFRERSWYLTWLATAPFLDPFRTDPRFPRLRDAVGLWPAAAAAPNGR